MKMDLNRVLPQISLLLMILLAFFKEGLGVKCYMCNSNIHKMCTDLKSISESEKIKYKVDCDKLPGNKNYTRCRKIDQSVQDKTSVVRQCATLGDLGEDCLSRVGTKKIKMKYCHCLGDYCNGATHKRNGGIISLLLTAVLSVYLSSDYPD